MRVLLVLGTSAGGVGHHVRSLAVALRAGGDDVLVAGPQQTLRAFSMPRVARTAVVEIGATPRPGADLRAARRLRGLAAQADVVHAHGLRAGLLCVLARPARLVGRSTGPPLVVTWHNAVLATGVRARLLGLFERAVAVGADVTLGASGDLVQRARALGARDARPAPVSAVRLPPSTRPRAEVRAELQAAAGAGDAPVVLAVGRLAAQKDYPTLLGAVGDAWPAGAPRPLVVVAGEGPLRASLEQRIARERLPVLLLGQRSDVPDLLAAADVYVLSSVWEARALVLQEAVRAGVPVVATAVGGVPELVGGVADLVPPGEPAALAAALARLTGDPARRARLAAAALERSAGWPDEDDTTRAVRAVYAGLVPVTGC